MIEEIKIDQLEELIQEMMKKIRDAYPTESAEGNPIEIENAAAAPLVKCVTAITGYQSGTGTPSPDNVRPIVAYTDNTILVGSDMGYNASDFTPHSAGISKTVESDGILFSANGSVTYQDIAIGANNSLIVPPGTYTIEVDVVSVSNTSAESMFGLRKANYSFITPTIDSSSVGHKSLTVTTEERTYISMSLNGSPSSQNAIKIKNFKIINVEQQSTTTFQNAIYRGSEDVVNGTVTTEWGMIDSYNGETLPGKWISDRDEYAPGTTPTAGAQVAYELETPSSASLAVSNSPIKSLAGYSHIESTTGEMEIEYVKKMFQGIVNLIPQIKVNSSGEATATLSKLEVDDVIYGLPD